MTFVSELPFNSELECVATFTAEELEGQFSQNGDLVILRTTIDGVQRYYSAVSRYWLAYVTSDLVFLFLPPLVKQK